MKVKPTPIAYPTTKENAELWGFDIMKPKGIPKAWIHDWSSASVGFGNPMKNMTDLMNLVSQKVSSADLSTLSADDLVAGLSFMYKADFHDFYELLRKNIGKDETLSILQKFGKMRGKTGWIGSQAQFGKPLPLDRIALYQDFVHTLFGPNMQPNTWFDDVKVVCSRTDCTFGPPSNKKRNAIYCINLCGGMTNGYMEVEPTLLTARLVDVGNKKWDNRCVHLWTYDSSVFDEIAQEYKDNIPESTKQMLRERNVEI